MVLNASTKDVYNKFIIFLFDRSKKVKICLVK